MRWLSHFIAAMLLCASSAVLADETPICPDRPSKSTGACTVPAGRWQIETGLVDWAHAESGGVTSDFIALGSSLLKLGVAGNADLELGFTPYEVSRVRGGGEIERDSGFGDMVARVKYRLTRGDADFQLALDPVVKIPTASHDLGNGKLEGGLVVPMSTPLGKSGITLSLGPELDWLEDGDGHGHHLAMAQVFNLGAQLSGRLSVSAELWGMWNWDPADTGKQASADGAVAYDVNNDLQLDAGANFGLNKETPDIELYAGVSKRF